MFSIGDFARYGRVSARMLRHYDAIGLLRPARTDPVTGYRFYAAAQLARLNRVIALKDLGFSLQQVAAILDEQVDVAELRGMLRLRQAELAAAREAAEARLGQVEARLRTIESEGHMSADDVVLKRTEPVLLAELSGIAASYGPEDIGPVITPLYEELFRRLAAAGVTPTGPGLAYYEAAPEDAGPEDGGAADAVLVHAGVAISQEELAKAVRRKGAGAGSAASASLGAPAAGLGFDAVTLPGLDLAATVVHRGPMSRIVPTAQHLAHWIDGNGYRSAGYARELYLECPDDKEEWVTEIQEPVVRA
ncbi:MULTISPECIES: MerR family transcriptional regulator [unclassified Streptomyces]|uniref:MerR family transcriptional regulator n=1 Tax=unclassified Streptomyces TaxID=2593676 RepID=UPI000C27CDE8|nr:MerR family transcriptional regulator [Streptomyces sp. CB02959]PJN41623.1 MerR family transcriptional regulator [Streptomyces sp. CB02959]